MLSVGDVEVGFFGDWFVGVCLNVELVEVIGYEIGEVGCVGEVGCFGV